MNTDGWEERIKSLISEKGKQGVNAIARELKVPLSNVQYYMTKQQEYFVKTDDRKWDLPGNIGETRQDNQIELLVQASLTQVKVIESQIPSLSVAIGTLKHQINQLDTAVTSIKVLKSKTRGLDPLLIKFISNIEELQTIIRKNKGKIPEDYRELLEKTNFLRLAIHHGYFFVNNTLLPELSSLILEETDKLTPQTVLLLEEYSNVTNRAEQTEE